MSAYIIGNFNITDFEKYKSYMHISHPIIEKYKAKILCAGIQGETREGTPGQVLVVMEFIDFETAKTYYESADYQKAASLRQSCADGWLKIVPGIAN